MLSGLLFWIVSAEAELNFYTCTRVSEVAFSTPHTLDKASRQLPTIGFPSRLSTVLCLTLARQ